MSGNQQTIVTSKDDVEPLLQIMPDGGEATTLRLQKRSVSIGSERGQDIFLNYSGIAPQMARLDADGISYRLFDLTEYPGDVMVNGKGIDDILLTDGDVIRLQNDSEHGVTITFLNAIERAKRSDGAGMYTFKAFPFTIGRNPDSIVQLEGLAVSWNHAQIVEQSGGHLLQDLSTNGTFVNDRRIKEEYKLKKEDVIRIDQAIFVYRGNALYKLASVQRFQLDALNLEMTYTTGLRRHRLNTMRDVSLSMETGDFIAIIGGSGSGKSTLLKALNGANPPTGGSVVVNGNNFYENYELYQPIMGYVPQSDIVNDKLTVEQSLTYSAKLRFPNEPPQSRAQRIDRALEQVQLKDYRTRTVGRLSGGQKKRVSIALELMAEPRLLFMDEPSSGLDPGLDRAMMQTLRRLANRGHCVAVVTHTTQNIDICDKLALMALGNLCYYGPPKEALTFFGVREYTEIYNKVLEWRDPDTKETLPAMASAKLWADRYRNSTQYTRYVIDQLQESSLRPASKETMLSNKRLSGSRRGSLFQQLSALTQRTMHLALNDIRTMIALMIVLPLVGLFLGLISLDSVDSGRGKMLVDRFVDEPLLTFFDRIPLNDFDDSASAELTNRPSNVVGSTTFTPASDAQRILFMLALAVTLLGIFAAAYTIVEEKNLFLRERMTNLRIAPYLLSKVLVYGGFALVSCFLALITLSFGIELPSQGLLLWGPLEIYITLALTALAGVTLGLMISSFARQINAVTYIVLALLFVQILFAGVLFQMNGALEIPSRLTITRWSLEALGSTADMPARDAESHFVVATVPVSRDTGEPLRNAPLTRQFYPAPSALSVNYASDAGGLLLRWGVLLAFSVIFLASAAYVLDRSDLT